MANSQNLKFNAIENVDTIIGIDIEKNVHLAGVILPNGKEIKELHKYLTTRQENQLKKKQVIVAVIGKILQIIYAVVSKNEEYKATRVFTQERLEQLKVA